MCDEDLNSSLIAAVNLAALQQTGIEPLDIEHHQTMDNIAAENYWLREKLKEVTSDRDRLLCEVANLKLELDIGELKRLPDDRYFIYIFFYRYFR